MAEDGDDPLGADFEVTGQLRDVRSPAELGFEAGAALEGLVEEVAGVHGQPDGATAVGDPTGDRLADPPGGVGGELEPLSPVELLDGVDEAEVALLDQVEEGEVGALVPLRDRHHESEVAVDEGLHRGVPRPYGAAELTEASGAAGAVLAQLGAGLPSGLGGLSQPGLVVLGEQRVAPDVTEVQADQVLVGQLATLAGHSPSSL